MDELAIRILEAVRKDDIKAFSYTIEQKKGLLSLCFGRFPLLSLCYLYNAGKIIEGYEKLLIQINSYTFVEEDFYSYKRFKARARTCLRLYFDKKIVTPLEMLAVMGDTYRLTLLYPKFVKDQTTDTNIKRIYKTLYGKEPKAEKDGLRIKRNKLKPSLFITVIIMIIVAAGMIVLPATALANITTLTGIGIAENPYKIFGEEQLASAFTEDNLHYILFKDITLTANWTPKNFGGILDGKGHTIFAGNHLAAGLIDNLSGSIANLNIVFGELKEDVSQNRWLVIKTNTGKATNINISVSGAFTESATDDDIYFSCFALENSGTINSCNIAANIEFKGNGGKDVFLTGLVAWNRGTIINCSLTTGSALTTDSVDVSGIATENGETGIIENCNNNAAINQTTSLTLWSPMSAGVAIQNYGEIKNCSNFAEISSSTTGEEDAKFKAVAVAGGIVAYINDGKIVNCINNGKIIVDTENATANAAGIVAYTNNKEISNCLNSGRIVSNSENTTTFASGIVCFNNGNIVKSKSDGKIEVSSKKGLIWVGGIAAENNYIIDNSCVYGTISLLTSPTNETNGIFYFCGGVSGINSGVIKDSYSVMDFSTLDNSNNIMIGGISSAITYTFYIENNNNFYLEKSIISNGNACVIINSIIRPGNDNSVTKLSRVEDIKALEVYWG